MEPRAPIAIFIITRNEAVNLPFTLASVRDWVTEIFVLDSGSTDATREVAESHGAKVFFREWDGYVNQKNWGLDNLPFTVPWIFILDADESITPALREEITRIASENRCTENGFYVNRHLIFMGRQIRHCGYYPSWNLRFFRRGKARYEQRAVHEHMIVDGPVGHLKAEMEHYDRRGMEYYIAKHNSYSTLEAREMYNVLTGRTTAAVGRFWGGDRVMRRRWLKNKIWLRLPARWLVRWFYMYLFKLGILDGIAGFHFCLFIAAYEHQITLKLHELYLKGNSSEASMPEPPPSPAPFEAAALEPPTKSQNGEATQPNATAPLNVMQQLDRSARFPYTFREYARRVAWALVRGTLFRFSPGRSYRWRNMLLRWFGGKIAPTAKVRPTTRIFHPWLLEMGEWSSIGDGADIYNLGPISIGSHSLISQRAYLCAGTHDYTHPVLPLERPPIRIGAGVWICADAFIGPGVSIGDNSVVGARAVVAKDVPAAVVVAGNPARVIKQRVMQGTVQAAQAQTAASEPLADSPDHSRAASAAMDALHHPETN